MKKRIKRPALSGTQIGIMLIGSLCLLLFGMLLAIQNYLEHQISEEQEQTVYFDRHYAMLLEENEDPFWTAVYDSAEQMGKEKNACVELIGEGMPSSFGLAGKLSVVIDSQVDGIIIRPDASDEVNELIEQAKKIFAGNLFNPCNMFIMKREVLNELCSWMFPILESWIRY